jgi:hypothetical protein
MRVQRDGYSLELDMNGDIALEPDASGVKSLGNGAYLDATMRRDGESRRVRFAEDDGDLVREFWLDGDSRPWGADADRFAAELTLWLFRSTGISAPQRLAWLLDNGGPERLLDEIALIDSDSVQRLYSTLYVESGDLASDHLRRLVSLAGARIDSDSQLRATLTSIYERQRPTGRELVELFGAARTIDSDSQARALLDTIGDSLPSADFASYLALASMIDSDSQLRAALAKVLQRNDLTEDHFGEILALAGSTIDSDSQLRALLDESVWRVVSSDDLVRAYLDAAESIASDSQAHTALLALADAGDLTADAWQMLLRGVRSIDSDSQAASLLVSIAPKLPRDQDTLAEYRRAVATIGSSSQAIRAQQALEQ